MRYSRQIKVIGKKAQEKLSKSTVAVVGIGALGTNVANLLARAGVNLILVDKDIVELSNLQRQTLFTEHDINKPKADAAKEFLRKVNSTIKITSHNINITAQNISNIDADVVVDCTDNLETRFLLNEFCCKNKIPLVHAAVAGTIGVLYNIIPNDPCFNCVYNNISKAENCENIGILAPTSSLISAIQASEVIKILTGAPEKNLLYINLKTNIIEKIKVKKNAKCEVCMKKYVMLEQKKQEFTVKFCKTKAAYSVKPVKNIRLNLNKIKKHFKTKVDTPIVLVVEAEDELIIHNYGEIVFKTMKNTEKIKEIAKRIYKLGQ